jgi:AAA15 family ATPase/GTPase
VHVKVKTTKLEPQFGAMAPQLMINGQPVQQVIPYQEVIEVSTDHIIHDGDKTRVYKLNMNDESLGTNQLFLMGPFLKDAFENGKTVIIDEIDKSLHTFIVKYLIKMFCDREINKGGAQLIFTTHDTSLLSLNTFRRDQIYFTEKNNENGISDLYSLDEFPVRKTDNIEKGYLLGRYGAIPYIKGEEL